METVIGTIGVVTLGSVVNSVTIVSSSVYSLITNIKLTKHIHQPEITKILTKSDMVATINLLNAVISEIPESFMNSISVIMALKNVQEIIENIEFELKEINNKLSYNNNLYVMSNWRSYDFKENLNSIELKVSILDRRRDNLFKILEVFKNLKISDTKEHTEKLKKVMEKNDFEIVNNELKNLSTSDDSQKAPF